MSPEDHRPLVRPGQRLASVEEFAAMVGVTRQFAHKLISNGAVASLKLGRRRLIPVAEIDRMIEERLAEGAAEREPAG